MSRRPAAFLDRDGVINLDREYVYRREEFEYVPGVFDGARELVRLGYALVVVTNQSGIARDLFTEEQFLELARWMEERFATEGAPIAATYFCPHHPSAALERYRLACNCRKPLPGMLLSAAAQLDLDLQRSAMFGDRLGDLEAARAADVPLRVLLGTDGVLMPIAPATDLVTMRGRSLAEVVLSEAFRQWVDARSMATR